MVKIDYSTIRDRMQPGDVIVFNGTQFISKLINLFSGGPSHVGMVRLIVDEGREDGKTVQIVESTISDKCSGVQTSRLSERLAECEKAGERVWWLPLSREVRKEINWEKFYSFIEACDNGKVSYDIPGLFGFLWRLIPIVGVRVAQGENKSKMFCSGTDAAILEAAGVLRGINISKISPQDIVEMNIYDSEYYQILGGYKELKRWNTV